MKDEKCLICGQSGHISANRRSKQNYSVIRRALLYKGLSVPNAAVVVASIMKTRFSVSDEPEVENELYCTSEMHHVTIKDEAAKQDENEVLTVYLRITTDSTEIT